MINETYVDAEGQEAGDDEGCTLALHPSRKLLQGRTRSFIDLSGRFQIPAQASSLKSFVGLPDETASIDAVAITSSHLLVVPTAVS
ncbi:hypothetical protein [Stutzerimonas nitrititolerans]|uniref:hypothetical protein n=1 Tax=Stutzerimonas nitrititolerans TaxID=2482751 RepID=UPI00289A2C12|nr:hypothetical protein [Stutzerimonas nitrititolerans]